MGLFQRGPRCWARLLFYSGVLCDSFTRPYFVYAVLRFICDAGSTGRRVGLRLAGWLVVLLAACAHFQLPRFHNADWRYWLCFGVVYLQVPLIVCVPDSVEVTTTFAQLFGVRIEFPQILVLYQHSHSLAFWPPSSVNYRCVSLLSTNKLLPADCDLPHFCGEPVWHEYNSTWYGQELGLCVGTAFEDFSAPGHMWCKVHTIHYNPTYSQITFRVVREIDRLEQFRVLECGSKFVLISAWQLSHLDVRDSRGQLHVGKFVLKDVGSNLALSKYAEVSRPLLVGSRHYLLTRLPFRIAVDTAYSHLLLDPPKPFSWRVGDEQCLTLLGVRTCAPPVAKLHTVIRTTRYRIPGFGIIRHAIEFVLSVLSDIFFDSLTFIVNESWQAILAANSSWRIFEAALLFSTVLLQYDSLWKALLALFALIGTFGLRR